MEFRVGGLPPPPLGMSPVDRSLHVEGEDAIFRQHKGAVGSPFDGPSSLMIVDSGVDRAMSAQSIAPGLASGAAQFAVRSDEVESVHPAGGCCLVGGSCQ